MRAVSKPVSRAMPIAAQSARRAEEAPAWAYLGESIVKSVLLEPAKSTSVKWPFSSPASS